MPKPRKPTNVLERSGAFRKDPQRARARAAEPAPTTGIGPCPARLVKLSKEYRGIWDEIVSVCAPGVLTCMDRMALEALVVLTADFRADSRGFKTDRFRQMMALWARFGLTPSDRSRVQVPAGSPTGNPFDSI